MKRLSLFCILLILCVNVFAQENLFVWKGDDICANTKFTPLIATSPTAVPPEIKKNLFKSLSVSSKDEKNSYTVKMLKYGALDETKSYDYFELWHNGKKILHNEVSDPLYTVRDITVETNNDYLLKVDLDDSSFAIFFCGWLYGYAEAPEMIVVVVNGHSAKIVFDNYAYAYKYTPGDNFAMEFIDNVGWMEQYEKPTAKVLSKLTKYKIWKEDNILKYKSWK